VHVPFCRRKCHYCHFLSSTRLEQAAGYIEDLLLEIKLYQEEIEGVTTLYFGGGTPSILAMKEMDRIFRALDLNGLKEVTLEVNPESLTLEKLKGYRALGINRISMGIQTSNDDFLRILGRGHTFCQARERVEWIKASGFDNFNVDLMYGLPGQRVEDVERDLEHFTALGAPHISAYGLTYDEGTDFHRRLAAGLLQQVSDEEDRRMFALIKERLGAEGLERYEISNFARPGYESRHNLIYWSGEAYIGLGPGAHGYLGGRRYENQWDFARYHSALERGEKPYRVLEEASGRDLEFEYLMLALRKVRGFEVEDFNDRFNKDFLKTYDRVLKKLLASGVLTINEGRVAFTDYGFDISNEALVHFMK